MKQGNALKIVQVLRYSLYLSLSLIFIGACVFALMIYTSLMDSRLPWYEPCGMQFLAILVMSAPLMCGISLGFCLLGRFMPVSLPACALPFATAILTASLPLIDGSLSLWMQLSGTLILVIAIVLCLRLAYRDFREIRKGFPAHQSST